MPANFDPTVTTFSPVSAYYFAWASKLAYAADPASDPLVEDLGLSDVQSFKDTDNGGPDKGVHCFVAKCGDAVILSFMGTSSIQGWLTDGNIQQISDPGFNGGGKVHQGFANGLKLVWDRVKAALPQKGSGAEIWITGHSLGGALATLAANWLCVDGNYQVNGTYTYGSPRTGNLDFFGSYKGINFRCVNNEDIVPHVPLELTMVGLRLFTYKHIGTLEYFDRNGQLGGGTSDWEKKKELMLDALADFEHPSAVEWPDPVRDHFIENYIDAIAKNLPAGTPTIPVAPKTAAEAAPMIASIAQPLPAA